MAGELEHDAVTAGQLGQVDGELLGAIDVCEMPCDPIFTEAVARAVGDLDASGQRVEPLPIRKMHLDLSAAFLRLKLERGGLSPAQFFGLHGAGPRGQHAGAQLEERGHRSDASVRDACALS